MADASWWPCALGLAAVLGHSYTCFLGFKGGKGVATSAGVFFGLAPLATSAVLGVFLAVFVAGRMVSLGSLVAAALLPAMVAWTGEWRPVAARASMADAFRRDWHPLARPVFWLACGVALLERTITERRPAYAEYIRRTSAFFPWPPKEGA